MKYWYEPTMNFLLPLAKDPKKDGGWKDEGYYAFSSTLATDGLGSVIRKRVA
jgi:hypothetical protein